MVFAMKQRIIAILLLLSVLCCAAALGEENDPTAARSDVEAAVRELLKEPWLPSDAVFNCEPVGGLWRLGLTRGNEALAEMYVDGDREAFVACYLTAGYAMPGLSDLTADRLKAAPEDLEEGGALVDEAEAIFTRLRGGELESMEAARCEYRISGDDWLYGLEKPGEQLSAVLILRVPEEDDASPQMLAYVDLHHNRDVRYPGCLSIDEALRAAVEACGQQYGRDTAEQLQMENAVMVVGCGESYSMAYEETGDAPETPFWTVSLLDMRAQPDTPDYDGSIELYRYHILLSPFSGEVLEIWTEDFGWG